jgi:hypothetical protein
VELISFDRDARGAGAQEGEHERGQGPGARGQTEADSGQRTRHVRSATDRGRHSSSV